MTQINPNIVDMSKMSPADMMVTNEITSETARANAFDYHNSWNNAPHSKESLNTDRKPLLIEKLVTDKYSGNVHVNRLAKIAIVAAYCLGLLATAFVLILGELAFRAIQNSSENKKNNNVLTNLYNRNNTTVLPSSKEILLLEDKKVSETKPTVCPQEDADTTTPQDTTPTQDNTSSQTTEPTKETVVEQRPVFGPEEPPKTQEDQEPLNIDPALSSAMKVVDFQNAKSSSEILNKLARPSKATNDDEMTTFEKAQHRASVLARPTNILSKENDPKTPLMIEDRLFAEDGTFLGLPETRHELNTLMASVGKEMTADQEAQLEALISKAEQEEFIAKKLIATGKKVTTGLLKQKIAMNIEKLIAIENNQKTYRARIFDQMRLKELYRQNGGVATKQRKNPWEGLTTNQMAYARKLRADRTAEAMRKANDADVEKCVKKSMDTLAAKSNYLLGNDARSVLATVKKAKSSISNTTGPAYNATKNGITFSAKAIGTGISNDVQKAWKADRRITALGALGVAAAAWASLPLTAIAGTIYAANHIKNEYISRNHSKVEVLEIEDK